MAIDPATAQASGMTPQDIQNYMTRKAMDDRMHMANELMYGKGQTQQPEMKHWTQLLGNLGNRYTGNKMWDQARQQGRASSLDDANTYKDATWPGAKPPVPGLGGPMQASGPIPQQIGPQTPGPTPGMAPPSGAPPQQMGGMPALGAPPPGMTPGDTPGAPPGGQNLPNEGGIFGGLGWKPVGWPQG